MRGLSLIVILLSILACGTSKKELHPEWNTLHFGAFKIKAPPGWQIFRKNGADSYVGGLAKGLDTLWFDYGLYGVDLEEEIPVPLRFARDTVNGLIAHITIPENAGRDYISMVVPRVRKDTRFTIYGKGTLPVDTILRIFKSVTFETSDTTVNPALSPTKFSTMEQSGKSLLRANCLSCHSTKKHLTGPPLGDILLRRSDAWICGYLRNGLPEDSLRRRRELNDGLSCARFPHLSCDEIALMLEYIRDL
ncbi:c-type cytochrome [Chitinophaga lutea]|nr:c-type cytochrome [Chitinophaga lutea]